MLQYEHMYRPQREKNVHQEKPPALVSDIIVIFAANLAIQSIFVHATVSLLISGSIAYLRVISYHIIMSEPRR